MSINENEPEEITETVINDLLVATHKITIEAKVDSNFYRTDNPDKIKEWLLKWKKFSLDLLEIKNGKIEIILFYTSSFSNTIEAKTIKIESAEEVLDKMYFAFQRRQPSYIKIGREDIKIKQIFLPEEENKFLVLF